ncbi:MAG: replicative DNA helicase [Candidatus Eisenbacteria bacterium]|nr:replicative DNA helicase [Candidatus Eisenbacteria bacterium]
MATREKTTRERSAGETAPRGAVREIIADRIPPQAVDAEVAVIGAMLLEDSAVGPVTEILDEQAFYRGAHRKIFRAIVDLFSREEAIDLVTVTQELKKGKLLDDVGGAAYLSQVLGSVATTANVRHHAKIVLEKAVLRKLINVATEVVQEAYDAGGDAAEILDRAEHTIFEIAQSRVRRDFVPMREILKHSFEVIQELYDKKQHVTGVASGFTDLDAMTSGFQKSDLVIVAGRPSMGKTAFALNIAAHASITAGIPTAIFSLEMGKEQLVQRMLCCEARVDAHKLRTGYLADKHWSSLTTAAGLLSESAIYIDDTPSMNVLEMRSKARRLKAEVDIGLVIVDYLQLMRGLGRPENRQQEISEISRSLKALAKELEVPVLALSQLSRAVESRGGDRRPILSDLRESGAIEQDADVVMFIYRAEQYERTPENIGRAEVIVGKQRNGPTGTVQLSFHSECTRFDNLSMRAEEPFEEL